MVISYYLFLIVTLPVERSTFILHLDKSTKRKYMCFLLVEWRVISRGCWL
ncbi:hypothetical protein Hanom_Chr06g00567511 [Helianthus anomalus]